MLRLRDALEVFHSSPAADLVRPGFPKTILRAYAVIKTAPFYCSRELTNVERLTRPRRNFSARKFLNYIFMVCKINNLIQRVILHL